MNLIHLYRFVDSCMLLILGTTTMAKQAKPWRKTCSTIQNTSNRMLLWPSKHRCGAGWLLLKRDSLRLTKHSWEHGSPRRMTLWPSECLDLEQRWTSSMGIVFVGRAMLMRWTPSSLTISITSTWWVLGGRRPGPTRCWRVPSRSPSPLLRNRRLLEFYTWCNKRRGGVIAPPFIICVEKFVRWCLSLSLSLCYADFVKFMCLIVSSVYGAVKMENSSMIKDLYIYVTYLIFLTLMQA